MAKKRKIYRLRNGDVIDVEEFHDGRYGARGMPRQKKKKPTKEDMQKVNASNKMKKARQRLLQYFDSGDIFATWTYQVRNRPLSMAAAVSQFGKAIRKVRREYRKRGYELFWMRNIERGTKGAWHIHLVVNRIEGTQDILEEAWEHGGTYAIKIKKSDFYDEDFTKLASYMTKDENTANLKSDGKPGKPRIKEASYNTSRNMQLPEPEVQRIVRWKKVPKPKKGYYIARVHEGINPYNGFVYRRYTMIRLHRRI